MYLLLCSRVVLDWFRGEANTYRNPSETYDRRGAYAAVADAAGRLTDDWEIAVVCDRDEIHGLALVRRAGKVGEVESRFELAAYRPFDAQVPIGEALADRATLTVSVRLHPSMTGGLQVAAASRNAWFPETMREYEAWAGKHNIEVELPPHINEERDHSILLARAAGVEDHAFREYRYEPGQDHYLDGLPSTETGAPQPSDARERLSRAMIEDRLIEQELERFSDLRRGGFDGTYRNFSDNSGREVMRIYNVNRERAERITGADLVYYNVDHQAMVLVQVKRLTKEGGLGKDRGYRPGSDRNFPDELERLRKVDATCRGLDGEAANPDDFRLYPYPCFFKFSDSLQPVVRKRLASPVSGFLLPLVHFDLQLGADRFKGPKGGTVIVKRYADRPLTPTMFAELVRGGFVGSRGTGTRYLQGVIDGLRDDRSLVIGVHREAPQATLF